ncbi:hypothetical protein [Hyphomonas pacifica]|uniref:hypothetical protein n=1 Tax=Hyphomonas pacifica TaxID=1280941 RepID=UPI000DBFCDA5|nr:hypothetical protein [Hyphomonas pacifica]RAN36400.1 hypothetical protein HY11_01370 [Hyphomonas pacifica]
MTTYYKTITNNSKLNTSSGSKLELPAMFSDLSALIISRCSFLQGLIQKVIYAAHGPELLAAKSTLKDFPNPKARLDFISTFPFSEADPIVFSVFNYSRALFLEIYDLRNVLAHEVWMSSKAFEGAVLCSRLNEEARLMMASGRVYHDEETKSHQVYDAIIRYIENIKIIAVEDLKNALKDADLCAWILMQISHVLNEQDIEKMEQMRRAFTVFKGTSHLFSADNRSSEKIVVRSLRKKEIRDKPEN